MEQKRKIVIPLGGDSGKAAQNFDGGMTVPAPLFDEEATLGARPVVPLAEHPKPAATTNRYPLIALLVLFLISASVAGGFALGLYRSRLKQQAASQTTSTTATSATTDTPAQLPAIATEKSPEPVKKTAANATTERAARDQRAKTNDENGEQEVIPPVEIRERGKERRESVAKVKDDAEREIRRQQRRERRRRARENGEEDADFDRQIERAGQEINRIREIFEGQRP